VSDDHFVGDLFVSVMVKQLWKLSNIEFTGSWVQHFFWLAVTVGVDFWFCLHKKIVDQGAVSGSANRELLMS